MKTNKLDNTEISGGTIIDGTFYPKKDLTSGTLRIVLTSKCNFNCTYCFNEGEDKQFRELDLEFIKKVIIGGKKFGIKNIKLTGGEPFIYSQLEELLKFINEKTSIEYIDITTNVSLLNEEKVNLLNKYSVNVITLSLDTLNKKRFEDLVQKKAYDKVRENMKNVLKKFNGRIRINCIVLHDDFEDYLEIISYCTKNKIGLRLVEPTEVEGKKVTQNKENFQKLKKILKDKCDKSISSKCSSVDYYFFKNSYITTMRSLCDNLLCENCKDYMYLRLTSDKKLKPCLARKDTEVKIKNTDKEEIKESFIKAIENMGRGLNEKDI